MRSVGTSFFLLIILFNWFGYRLAIGMLETGNNTLLEAQLDENRYDESQLVSFKVPVRYLPYYNNSTEFQRVDGQIEIGGIVYKYVKRRIYNDSLEMLCIPNPAAMQLRTAENEFFRFSNDLAHGRKNGDLPHARKFFPIHQCTVQRCSCLLQPLWAITIFPSSPADILASWRRSPADQPPELA